MPVLQMTVLFELDGKELTDLTMIRRLVMDNLIPLNLLLPDNAAPAPIKALGDITTLQALVIRATDQPIILGLQTSDPGAVVTPIAINPGGVVVMLDTSIAVAGGSPEFVTLKQNSGQSSAMNGLVGGSSQ